MLKKTKKNVQSIIKYFFIFLVALTVYHSIFDYSNPLDKIKSFVSEQNFNNLRSNIPIYTPGVDSNFNSCEKMATKILPKKIDMMKSNSGYYTIDNIRWADDTFIKYDEFRYLEFYKGGIGQNSNYYYQRASKYEDYLSYKKSAGYDEIGFSKGQNSFKVRFVLKKTSETKSMLEIFEVVGAEFLSCEWVV
ncbi:hypothetical protein CEE44_00085 [Candidatus Woesearchaeota archaeon B3_Woes]|nr:MAG: hypothetical protein CEE44_00085 [Candidatus Woesearchaeota archaeon B3_Woes]